jgi:hypothetical protein
MAGGERERKRKKKKPRFNDLKRPKPTKVESKLLADKKKGFGLRSSSCSMFKFCPEDGHKLTGRMYKCPKCLETWVGKFLSDGGPSEHAVLVDVKAYLQFWRRKIFWRLAPPFYAWVVWTSQSPIPIWAFNVIFKKNRLKDAHKTSSVVTTIKKLKTTRAVEDSLRFDSVNADKGWGSGKLLSSGSVLVVVPPLGAIHTDSKVAGSKVTITYGWVILIASGNIMKAESMEEPA